MFSCNKPCNACLHKHSTNLAHEPTEQTTPALHVWSEMPFKGQLFISRCEIKSGIHEPRIGNAVPAGDAGECDTPAKVRLNNEMCHFVPCSPTATESSFGSSRPVLVGACERRCTFGRLYSKNRQKPTAKNANCLTKLVLNDILVLWLCAPKFRCKFGAIRWRSTPPVGLFARSSRRPQASTNLFFHTALP